MWDALPNLRKDGAKACQRLSEGIASKSMPLLLFLCQNSKLDLGHFEMDMCLGCVKMDLNTFINSWQFRVSLFDQPRIILEEDKVADPSRSIQEETPTTRPLMLRGEKETKSHRRNHVIAPLDREYGKILTSRASSSLYIAMMR